MLRKDLDRLLPRLETEPRSGQCGYVRKLKLTGGLVWENPIESSGGRNWPNGHDVQLEGFNFIDLPRSEFIRVYFWGEEDVFSKQEKRQFDCTWSPLLSGSFANSFFERSGLHV